MTNLFDDLVLDTADDGGSSPRRGRGLSESMIAGRRKPGQPAGGSASKPAADEAKPTIRRRAPRAEEAPPAEDGKPAPTRRRRTSAAAEEAETAEPVRRTRARRAPGAAPASRTSRTENEASKGMIDEGPVAEPASNDAPPPESLALPPITELPPVAPSAPLPPGDLAALTTEVTRLRGFVEQQRTVLAELRAGILTLGQQVDRSGYRPRLGIFVDVPNLMYGVESSKQVHMGRLLDMLREGRQLVRATAYSPVSDDPREPLEQQKFVAPFVPYDYRIVTKSLKRFADGSIKGNFDVEMAIDMILMADRVDVIAIVSGDADFARAVESVQGKGVRVEVVAFGGSTSLEMRALADHYLELSTVADRIVV